MFLVMKKRKNKFKVGDEVICIKTKETNVNSNTNIWMNEIFLNKILIIHEFHEKIHNIIRVKLSNNLNDSIVYCNINYTNSFVKATRLNRVLYL